MTRHQRRKAAAIRANDKLERLANAARYERNAAIVASNLSCPVRSPLTPKGLIGSIYDLGRHKK